jgi:four helix bundle protein
VSRDYKKLKVFRVIDDLVVNIYKATASFPKSELFGLTSQMRRAAVSVPANIVEGAARRTDSEFANFLNISYGSLAELRYFIDLSLRLEYFDTPTHDHLAEKADEASRMLNGLMKSVRNS